MGLTRVTTTVIDANALSAALLANGSIEARHIAPGSVGIAALGDDSNVAAAHIDLTANIDLIQDNVDVNILRINSTNQNIASVISNATSLGNHANTNLDTKANVSATYFLALANDLVTYTQLNANIDVVHANANGITDDSSVIFNVEKTFADDVIITGNLIVNGDTVTANSINMVVEDRMMMLANSVTGSPSADVGLLFNRGNQGNAAFFYDETAKTFKISDTKDPSSNTVLSPVTAGNLDVGILTAATLKYGGTSVNDAITDNRSGAISSVFATDLTASRALASDGSGKIQVATTTLTELNHVNGVTGAIQTQLDTKDTVANVFNTYTRLNANINVVQDNITSTLGLVPFVNVITTAGSNAVGIGADTSSDANVITVSLDGVVQGNTEFVMDHGTNVLQFKDASLPSGSVVTIFSLV